ncbi:hypothetical protein P3L10_009699 [Capsicum annuum]
MSSASSTILYDKDFWYCKCGHEALLKTSWTQQNSGRRFFTCKISKKLGGCDYFDCYEDRHSSQANLVIWGLLNKFKTSEEKQN